MVDGLEPLRGLPGHALRRGIGGDEIGMGVFERLQLAHQRVELGVGDLGVVENVVPLFVMPNAIAQLLDLPGGDGQKRVVPWQG